MAIALRRRSLIRILLLLGGVVIFKILISQSSTTSVSSLYASDPQQIQKQGVLDLVTRGEKVLDARKHKFLQVRVGRDERPDLFSETIDDGIQDFWDRYQKPLYVPYVLSARQESIDFHIASKDMTRLTWTHSPC